MKEKIRDSLSVIGVYCELLVAIVKRIWYWIPKFATFNSEIDYDIDQMTIVFLNRRIRKAEKHIDKYHNKKTLSQMKTARDLLVRIKEDYYWDELYKYTSGDYIVNTNGHLEFTTTYDNLGEYYDLHKSAYRHVLKSMTYANLSKKLRSNDTDKQRRLIASLIKLRLIQKSRELAYKIITEYSLYWW